MNVQVNPFFCPRFSLFSELISFSSSSLQKKVFLFAMIVFAFIAVVFAARRCLKEAPQVASLPQDQMKSHFQRVEQEDDETILAKNLPKEKQPIDDSSLMHEDLQVKSNNEADQQILPDDELKLKEVELQNSQVIDFQEEIVEENLIETLKESEDLLQKKKIEVDPLKLTPSWINDHADVSLTRDLGLTDFDEVEDFLKIHGKDLKSLNLEGLHINDKQFEQIIDCCPHLTHIAISSDQITNQSLKCSSRLPLTSISFRACIHLTDEGMEHLKWMPLMHIDFSECVNLSDIALEYFKPMSLLSVKFSKCPKLTDKALEHLKEKVLMIVDFSYCDFTNKGVEFLKDMPLVSINLSYCSNLTNQGLMHLERMSLKHIDLRGCNKITDKGLEYLKRMPLTSFSFEGCEKISQSALENFTNSINGQKQ